MHIVSIALEFQTKSTYTDRINIDFCKWSEHFDLYRTTIKLFKNNNKMYFQQRLKVEDCTPNNHWKKSHKIRPRVKYRL